MNNEGYQDLFGMDNVDQFIEADYIYINNINELDKNNGINVNNKMIFKSNIILKNNVQEYEIKYIEPLNSRVYNIVDVGTNGDFIIGNSSNSNTQYLNNVVLSNVIISNVNIISNVYVTNRIIAQDVESDIIECNDIYIKNKLLVNNPDDQMIINYIKFGIILVDIPSFLREIRFYKDKYIARSNSDYATSTDGITWIFKGYVKDFGYLRTSEDMKYSYVIDQSIINFGYIYKSIDYGNNISIISGINKAFQLDCDNSGRFVCYSDNLKNVFLSSNYAVSFTNILIGPFNTLYQLKMSKNGLYIYLSYANNSLIYKYDVLANTWVNYNLGFNNSFYCVNKKGDILYLFNNSNIYKSSNFGETFELITNIGSGSLMDISTNDNGDLVCVSLNHSVFISYNSGLNFIKLYDDVSFSPGFSYFNKDDIFLIANNISLNFLINKNIGNQNIINHETNFNKIIIGNTIDQYVNPESSLINVDISYLKMLETNIIYNTANITTTNLLGSHAILGSIDTQLIDSETIINKGIFETKFSETSERALIGDNNFDTNLQFIFRVKEQNNIPDRWVGSIACGGLSKAIVMGQYNSQSWIGAHSGALNAWSDLFINPQGGRVQIGSTLVPKALLDVNGSLYVGDDAKFQNNIVVENINNNNLLTTNFIISNNILVSDILNGNTINTNIINGNTINSGNIINNNNIINTNDIYARKYYGNVRSDEVIADNLWVAYDSIMGNIYCSYVDADSLKINSLNNSTSTTTGALVVSGGVGINRNLNIGGNIRSNTYSYFGNFNNRNFSPAWGAGCSVGSTTNSFVCGVIGSTVSIGGHNSTLTAWADVSINPTTSTSVFLGAANNISGTFTCYKPINIINSMQSTSTTTGALTITGGASVQGNLFIGGNVSINRDLSIGNNMNYKGSQINRDMIDRPIFDIDSLFRIQKINTITFPVSDTTGIRGAACSYDGKIIVCVTYFNGVYISRNFGKTFDITGTNSYGRSVSISSDGKNMLTAITDYYYISTDYGYNWVTWNRGPSQHQFVAVAGNGLHAIITTTSGYIVSSNFSIGNNWSALREAGVNFNMCGLSENGEYSFVCGTNGFRFSNNFTSSYSLVISGNFIYGCISKSGRYITAYNSSNNTMNISNNFGASFTISFTFPGSNPSLNTLQYMDMSNNGSLQYFIYNRNLYESSNYGANWEQATTVGTYSGVICSGTGENITLLGNINTTGATYNQISIANQNNYIGGNLDITADTKVYNDFNFYDSTVYVNNVAVALSSAYEQIGQTVMMLCSVGLESVNISLYYARYNNLTVLEIPNFTINNANNCYFYSQQNLLYKPFTNVVFPCIIQLNGAVVAQMGYIEITSSGQLQIRRAPDLANILFTGGTGNNGVAFRTSISYIPI